MIRKFYLKNWKKYNLTENKEEFIALLNILEAHGENLDSLHNASSEFCGITTASGWEDDIDIVKALFEYHVFFKSKEEFLERMRESAAVEHVSLEKYLQEVDYKKTTDGMVEILHY